MSKVVFETATIADSISKAAKVAPTKGEGWDKAAGILISLDPEDTTVTLRTTDMRIFYLEVVDALEVDEEDVWRVPHRVIAAIMAKLPIGSGKTVTLEKEGGILHIRSGTTRAQVRMSNPDYYPTWDPFDPDKLEMVPDLGARLKQVEWAAASDGIPLDGLHLDGEHIIATDRFKMAVVPCEAEPIYKPITIPAGILSPVLGSLRDVAIGIDEGKFLLMPDVATQIATRIYDEPYPNILAAMNRVSGANSVKIRKQDLLDIMDRATVFVSTRAPSMTFIVGKGEIAVMCSEAELGLLGDQIDVEEGADHPRHKILFTPKNLMPAIDAAPSEHIEFFYDVTDSKQPVKIDGGSGYVAVVMPRRELEGGGNDPA